VTAMDPSGSAASGLTAAVAGFCRISVHRERNTKRHCQTKQTIHHELLQTRHSFQTRLADPRRTNLPQQFCP
jgi:hypothetical protein